MNEFRDHIGGELAERLHAAIDIGRYYEAERLEKRLRDHEVERTAREARMSEITIMNLVRTLVCERLKFERKNLHSPRQDPSWDYHE